MESTALAPLFSTPRLLVVHLIVHFGALFAAGTLGSLARGTAVGER